MALDGVENCAVNVFVTVPPAASTVRKSWKSQTRERSP